MLKYTGIFGGVQGLKLLVGMVRNKLTSLFLGGTGMGLISVYNSITEFLVNSSNMCIPINATRETSELYEADDREAMAHKIRVIRTWVLWTALLAVFVCLAFSPFISYFFFDHDFSRFREVIILLPIPLSFIVAEGECAILKGLSELKKLAIIETAIAVFTLFLTVPFYYLMGLRGVIWGLTLSGLSSVVTHFWYSLRLFPYRVNLLSKSIFKEGLPMVTKGIPYVLAGIANGILAMFIPILILSQFDSDIQGMAEVGYYKVGYTLIAGYAGIAFVALEAAYYPRLASVCNDLARLNKTINQQIDVCVMLISPFLILFILFMPQIITLLYTPEFLKATDMTIYAALYVFFRAIMLPIAYTPLAKGDSVIYLAMEVLYDVFFALFIYILYTHWQLMGAGIALSLGAFYDVVVCTLVYGNKYGCRIQRSTVIFSTVQFVILIISIWACLALEQSLMKYVICIPCALISFVLSVRKLRAVS